MLRQVLITVGSAVANFLGRPTWGVAISSFLKVSPPVNIGVSVEQSPSQILASNVLGISTNASVSGDPAKPATSVGLNMAPVTALSPAKPAATAGLEIVHIKYDLTATRWATAAVATNEASGQNWANTANAIGETNTTTANIQGDVLNASAARLDLSYAGIANKDSMTIQSVKIKLHSQMLLTIGAMTLTAQYSLNNGANWTDLFVRTAAFNNLVAGEEFDITAAVGGVWSKLSATNFKVRFRAQMAALQTVQAFVDSAGLIVTATLTDPQ